jgi:hypothetical protein
MKMRLLAASAVAIMLCTACCEKKGPTETAGQKIDNAGQAVHDAIDPPGPPQRLGGPSIMRWGNRGPACRLPARANLRGARPTDHALPLSASAPLSRLQPRPHDCRAGRSAATAEHARLGACPGNRQVSLA